MAIHVFRLAGRLKPRLRWVGRGERGCLCGAADGLIVHADAGVLVLGTLHVKSKTQERVWVGSAGGMLFLL